MKTALSVFLAVTLAALPASASTNAPAAKPQDCNVLLCLLVVSAAVVAGAVVFYVHATSCQGCSNKRLILERDNLDGNWTPIKTNDVSGVCTNRYEIFRQYTTDSAARYRVRILPLP